MSVTDKKKRNILLI